MKKMAGGSTEELLAAARTENVAELRRLATAGTKLDGLGNEFNRMITMASKVVPDATALFWSAWEGRLTSVRVLLELGADVNMGRPDDGMTPLYAASWKGNRQVVEAVIEAKADLDAPTDRNKFTGVQWRGASPLWIAAFCGHTAVANALVTAGADHTQTAFLDDKEYTPLEIALHKGKSGVALAIVTRVVPDKDKLDAKRKPGDKLEIYAKGVWYRATVKSVEKDGFAADFDGNPFWYGNTQTFKFGSPEVRQTSKPRPSKHRRSSKDKKKATKSNATLLTSS